ncbi:hypothetical protein F4824DRAFT_462586 [Ustulina deusta]|nr:hypothetical protein F4824DRAFT_462586 [Ustulina deusta]
MQEARGCLSGDSLHNLPIPAKVVKPIQSLVHIMPPHAIFRARYTDQEALAEHLYKIFPGKRVQIKYERGCFRCTIPRTLTPEENREIELAITKDHYDTVPA